MMTREYIAKPLYDKQRARAQLMTKVSWSLVAIVFILTMLLFIQGVDRAELMKENNELQEYIAALSTSKVSEPEGEPVVQTSAPSPALVDTRYIGDYTITYYCPCEECCGEYASNRPIINNKKVVVTSTGAYAQDGITVAVDPNKIPYGSLLYIEGVGYRIAQDCGGAIKGNRIDVYMDSHQEALQKGVHESKIYIITTGGTTR